MVFQSCNLEGIDFNLASIPQEFGGNNDQPFDQQYMNALFDRAYSMAAHNYHWAKAPPGLETSAHASK